MKQHVRHLFILLCIAAVYAGILALGIRCPILHIFGISCPGCGMTRATLSAIAGDLSAAFAYHPLWVALLPALALLLFLHIKGYQRAWRITVYILGGALIAVYLIRLITGCAPEVVAFAPQEGAVARLWRALLGQ